jgi:hypothetical protein
MEVHAHTHTSRKKWTHYLWEFLMLFFAVFCGFLAENQREHIVEHSRELKYAASLYEDLKKDTADLVHDIPFWEMLTKKIDTIRQEIEKPRGMRNDFLLYRCVALMRAYNNFQYHDRTIEQLKNGGNFRLIRKSVIADSIIDYDALIKSELRDQEMQSNNIYQTINYLQDKFFNSKYFLSILREKPLPDSLFDPISPVFKVPAFYEPDLFQYGNHLEYYYTMTGFRLWSNRVVLRKANNLIELLKREYRLH